MTQKQPGHDTLISLIHTYVAQASKSFNQVIQGHVEVMRWIIIEAHDSKTTRTWHIDLHRPS